MSFEATAAVWKIADKLDSATDLLVLLCLANYADADARCYPGREHIASKAKCSVASVKRSLARLTIQGHIIRDARKAFSGAQTSNIYTLLLPGLSAAPPAHCEPPPGSHVAPPRLTVSPNTVNPTNQTNTVTVDLPTKAESEAPRASDVQALIAGSLGKGGVVTPAARRKAAATLGVADITPLIAIYEAWAPSRRARDPDGHFLSVAEKLWRGASPEVKAACRPLAAEREIAAAALAPARNVRASSSLARSALVAGRQY